MVATNIVCAVVAVVVLGGDGAGGRARGVDHVTSLRAAPLLLRLGVTFLPPSRLGDEPRPVFALGRGPRRGSYAGCWSGHWWGEEVGHCAAASTGTKCRTRGNTGLIIYLSHSFKPLQFSVNQACFAKATSLT